MTNSARLNRTSVRRGRTSAVPGHQIFRANAQERLRQGATSSCSWELRWSCVGARGKSCVCPRTRELHLWVAPPKFDKKFQIFMGAAKEIWQNKSNFQINLYKNLTFKVKFSGRTVLYVDKLKFEKVSKFIYNIYRKWGKK